MQDDPAPTGVSAAGWLLVPRCQLAALDGEWRAMCRPESLLADALASIAGALIAVPLLLAIVDARVRKRLRSIEGPFFDRLRWIPVHSTIEAALEGVDAQVIAEGGCSRCADRDGCDVSRALGSQAAARGRE